MYFVIPRTASVGRLLGAFSQQNGKVSRMVEAAGVEPASENTSSQPTTCVSPFSLSQPVRNGAKCPGRHLRKISPSRVGAARDSQPADWRSFPSRRHSREDR